MSRQNYPVEETEVAMDSARLTERPADERDFDIFGVLTQLAFRKWLIAKVTAVAILVGLVLALALPAKYVATTKIMPPQQTQSAVSMMMNQLTGANAGSLAAMAGGGLALKSPNDIYIGLLSSRTIADAIIEKFNLMSVYRVKDMTAARKALARNTEITSEKSGFIVVSITDGDKARVAQIANAYTDQLRVLTKTLAVSEASQRRLFYEDQLKQAKDSLVAAELTFQQVQQQKGLVQLDAQARVMIEGLASLRAQVATKEVEVQALRSYSTEQNPDLQLAEKQLASLQSEETSFEQSNHGSGIRDLGLENVPSAGLEYLRAQHELQYRQLLFDTLMKQFDAARLDESKDATIIQIVEPAISPDRRSSPKRTLIILGFFAIGFIGASVYAIVVSGIAQLRRQPTLQRQIETLLMVLKQPPGSPKPKGNFSART